MTERLETILEAGALDGTTLTAEQCRRALAALRVAKAAAEHERDAMDLEKTRPPTPVGTEFYREPSQPCIIALNRSRDKLQKALAAWAKNALKDFSA